MEVNAECKILGPMPVKKEEAEGRKFSDLE